MRGGDYGATAATAERFLRHVAERLGVSPGHVFPAFEDAFYYLWRERRLPANVDPLNSKLDDPQERERLLRVFGQGLDRIAGQVLPIARDADSRGWQSGSWFLRTDHCYLIPGDSAMGYRLPLDSQPWVSAEDYPYTLPPDPMEDRPALPTVSATSAKGTQQHAQRRHAATAAVGRTPKAQESASWITRTALCAEPRAGVLYIFMPPTADARRLSGTRGCHRTRGTRIEATGDARGLRAAARCAPEFIPHNARSRGHRSQCAALA